MKRVCRWEWLRWVTEDISNPFPTVSHFTLTLPFHKDFMKRLHLEVLKLEFHQSKIDERGTMSMKDFAAAMVSYVHPMDAPKYQNRVMGLKKYEERITFQQFFGKCKDEGKWCIKVARKKKNTTST